MFESPPTLQALGKFHPHAATTFRTAINNDRLHHAYLLMCNQKSASQTLAVAVAQSLMCQNLDESSVSACQQCTGCRQLGNGSHPDLLVVQPDEKGKIRIGAIRTLSNRLGLRPTESTIKVVLLFGADQMNPAAQNALLKTLEEPPGNTCLLLTACRYRFLLPTIRSRVQRIQLSPPNPTQAASFLLQGGIPSELCPTLGALVGSDLDTARAMVEQGVGDVLEHLQEIVQSKSTSALLHLAADLGSSKERTQLALTLLEVITRDGLAQKWGARDNQLHGQPHLPTGAFDQAASQLQQLRRHQMMNPNATISLESVLLQLTTSVVEGRQS